MGSGYKQFPEQHGSEVLTGTSTGEVVQFGFRATYVRLDNLGTTAEVHFDLSSTGGATTGSALLPIGGTVEIPHVPPCSAIGLATASTSTTAALRRVSLIALGG